MRATAEEASAVALAGPLDLLILDWSAPDRGLAVSGIVRNRPWKRASLVVALVGEDEPQQVTEALASGAEDFLVKSPDPATLVAWLVVMEARVDERAAVVEKERLVLRALMDHFPGNIYFKDTQSRFTRTNRAFAEYVGVEDAALVAGRTDYDIFSAEHAKQAFEDEQEVIRTGVPIAQRGREGDLEGRARDLGLDLPRPRCSMRRDGSWARSASPSTSPSARTPRRRSARAKSATRSRAGVQRRPVGLGRRPQPRVLLAALEGDARPERRGDRQQRGSTGSSRPPDEVERVRAAALERASDRRDAALRARAPGRHKDGRYRWMLCRGIAVRDAGGHAPRAWPARRPTSPIASRPRPGRRTTRSTTR